MSEDREKTKSIFRDIDSGHKEEYSPPGHKIENPKFTWREGFGFVLASFRIILPLALLFLLPAIIIMILLFWLFPESTGFYSSKIGIDILAEFAYNKFC